METFQLLTEAVYHFGARLIFGTSEKSAMLRVILIGGVLGWLGIAPLSLAILAWAAYVCLFAAWQPPLREISGFYIGNTMVLCIVLSAVWLARHFV